MATIAISLLPRICLTTNLTFGLRTADYLWRVDVYDDFMSGWTKLFPVYNPIFFIFPFQYSESSGGGKKRIKAKYKPQIINISSTCLCILTLILGKKYLNFNSIILVIVLFPPLIFLFLKIIFSVLHFQWGCLYPLDKKWHKKPTRALCYRKQI